MAERHVPRAKHPLPVPPPQGGREPSNSELSDLCDRDSRASRGRDKPYRHIPRMRAAISVLAGLRHVPQGHAGRKISPSRQNRRSGFGQRFGCTDLLWQSNGAIDGAADCDDRSVFGECLGRRRQCRNTTRGRRMVMSDRSLRLSQWRPRGVPSHTSRNHGVRKQLNRGLAR